MSTYCPALVSCSPLPVALTPMTPGTSTGTIAQAFVTLRPSITTESSGLVSSCDGCEMSSDWLPAAETTVTPCCSAYRMARCSAFQMARWVASFLQLNSHGSAK